MYTLKLAKLILNESFEVYKLKILLLLLFVHF